MDILVQKIQWEDCNLIEILSKLTRKNVVPRNSPK